MSKILRFKSVMEKTGLSRNTIYIKLHEGTFPKPLSLGPNSIGWLEADINEWIHGLPIAPFARNLPTKDGEAGRALAKASETNEGIKRNVAA